MNDHDLDARLRAKYRSRSTDAAPPTLARRVLAIPADSPHRRGWLPWPLFGGTTLMFSATKAVVAAAILAVGGYVLVGNGETTQAPSGAIEWAEADVGPRVISGSVKLLGDEAMAGDEPTSVGPSLFEWTTDPARVEWASSDPRLSGTGYVSEHGIQHTRSYTGLRSELWSLVNDDGSWSGTGDSYSSPRGARGFITLTGSGAYEGLTVFLAIDEVNAEAGTPEGQDEGGVMNFEGVVMPYAPPSAPGAE